MSLLNAGLKLAISAINLIDVFKALTASGSKSATAPSFSELGRATSTTHRLVRDAVGTPSRQPHTRYRIGSTQRRQQLRLALSLVVVWTLYQSVEPVLDAIASYIIPFYSTLKTAFLLWLFFARTGASMRIISTLINPVLAPYQVLIDAIISSTLNLFYNLTFLASLPISWGLLYVRRSTGRVVNWARLWVPWREAKIEDSPSKSVRNGDGSPRMPPPSLSTRRRPRPSSDGSPSLSAPTQRHRAASLGMGRPAQLAPHSSARSVSSSSGSSRPTAPSAATMKALQDLPPAPTGFFTTSQAGDGSFAFIPGGQKEETEDASLPAALDPFTPSILPGGFGLSNVVGKKRGPLKMPAAAKARNSKATSSFSAAADKLGARAALVKQDAKKSAVKGGKQAGELDAMDEDEEEDGEEEQPLFRGQDEEEQEPTNKDSVITPSRRRRKESIDAPSSALASASKRPKLQVFEDPSLSGSEPTARRSTRASSSRANSRANSVVDGEEVSEEAATNGRRPAAKRGGDVLRPPLSGLPRSVSTRGGRGGILTRSTSSRTLGEEANGGKSATTPATSRGKGGATTPKGRAAAVARGGVNGRGGGRGVTGKTSSMRGRRAAVPSVKHDE